MTKVEELFELMGGLTFEKHGYAEAERQLTAFAGLYVALSPEEVRMLRGKVDGKKRLGLFQIASSIVMRLFHAAEIEQKRRLFNIMFATYSFDNLGFGYDTLIYLNGLVPLIRSDIQLARECWPPFKALSDDSRAINNLETTLNR